MSDEKKTRERTPRTEKEQAFMDAVHEFRKYSYPEVWQKVKAAALEFKRDKLGRQDAVLE